MAATDRVQSPPSYGIRNPIKIHGRDGFFTFSLRTGSGTQIFHPRSYPSSGLFSFGLDAFGASVDPVLLFRAMVLSSFQQTPTNTGFLYLSGQMSNTIEFMYGIDYIEDYKMVCSLH